MNEQEILTQLRKAAEEIEIPETLKPEQIEKQFTGTESKTAAGKSALGTEKIEENNSMAQTWKYGGSAGTGSMQRNLYNSDPFR